MGAADDEGWDFVWVTATADAGGAVELSGRKGHGQRHLEGVKELFAEELHAVDDEGEVMFLGEGSRGGKVCFNACDVARGGEGEEARLGGDGSFNLRGVEGAPEAGGEVGDGAASFLRRARVRRRGVRRWR